MIYEIEPLPFKIGINAEEHEGLTRINLTLYSLRASIYANNNKAAILETNYIDANHNLHSLKAVKKQIRRFCKTLIGRQYNPANWFDDIDQIDKRINDIVKSTVLEEKLKQERFLSKFHNDH
jgi:hypothetical protein